MAEKMTGKVKAHMRYRTADNKIVPGVTTITGVMAKPALIPWANRLGLQGINSSSYVDEKASIGTCAHYMVECDLKNETPDLSDYTTNQIDMADNCMIKYYTWKDKYKPKVLGVELELVSENHRYGGKCDIYAEIMGKRVLVDLKTSKGIFPEMFTQVGGGYRPLLIENGLPVDETYILRIGRTEEEGHEYKPVTAMELHEKRFLVCLELYNLNKMIKAA